MTEVPIRVACIGAGYFAAFHHGAWAAEPRAELVAIVDRDPDRAEAATRAAGTGTACTTLDAALNLGRIDLIDIATPPDTHLDLIDAATAVGCAVICQKPFCGGLADARRAVDLAESRALPLIVHENFRFQPWWRAIRAELAAGRAGDVFQTTFRLRPGDGQGPDAYLARQPYFQRMERFLIHETGVHFVDVFRYLMGEPDWVQADLRRLNPAIAGEDAGHFTLGYGDGRRAVFDGNRLSDHAARNHRLTMGEAWIEGAAGTLTLDGDGTVGWRAMGAATPEPVPVMFDRDAFGGGCVAALQSHVVQCLIDGRAPENTGRDYLRNLDLVEAIYRSHETGARISVAPDMGGR